MKDRDPLDIKWTPDTQKTTKTDCLLARFDGDDTNNTFKHTTATLDIKTYAQTVFKTTLTYDISPTRFNYDNVTPSCNGQRT